MCRACKRAPATTVDHIHEIQDGGPAYDISNLQPLCSICHGAKTALRRTPQQIAAIRRKRQDRDDKDFKRPRLTYRQAKRQHEATDRWLAQQEDATP